MTRKQQLIRELDEYAQMSPASTKVACVFVDEEKEVIAAGWNLGPDHHAEIAAIVDAARSGIALQGTTAWVNWFPCKPCAVALSELGIKKLMANYEKYCARKDDPKYDFAGSMQILEGAGIKVKWYDHR